MLSSPDFALQIDSHSLKKLHTRYTSWAWVGGISIASYKANDKKTSINQSHTYSRDNVPGIIFHHASHDGSTNLRRYDRSVGAVSSLLRARYPHSLSTQPRRIGLLSPSDRQYTLYVYPSPAHIKPVPHARSKHVTQFTKASLIPRPRSAEPGFFFSSVSCCCCVRHPSLTIRRYRDELRR